MDVYILISKFYINFYFKQQKKPDCKSLAWVYKLSYIRLL